MIITIARPGRRAFVVHVTAGPALGWDEKPPLESGARGGRGIGLPMHARACVAYRSLALFLPAIVRRMVFVQH